MDQNFFNKSRTSEKWKRIGVNKRAGVALPLFSIYSKKSIGIGEIPDLKLIVDWCCRTGLSIIQLLPLNEVGFDFAPYNALSTFALEPMYLSINNLRKTDIRPFRKEITELKKKYPKGTGKVNYEIKDDKLKLLRNIFITVDLKEIRNYERFVKQNIQWLKYYSLYKILMEKNGRNNWAEWELKHSYLSSVSAEKLMRENQDEMNFYYWLQWQLYEQMKSVKRYAAKKKIFLMGDLPFLVSRNSADVWAYKNYFKLNKSSGAPPDMYFSRGQRWGMPPYNWENIEAQNFAYLKERLKYAENFYDMFRIDHFVGLFRVWTIDLNEPEEFAGLNGKFDPEEEYYWEGHGVKILEVMNECSDMLPCAEDLGTVPECSGKVLKEFGITGIDVQRWEKSSDHKFIPSESYRLNSVATVSTHDSSSFPAWWKYEAGTIDEFAFGKICEKTGIVENEYENLKEKLFIENEKPGARLRWREEISNVYVLLNELKRTYEQAGELVDIYLSTYTEKNNFLLYNGFKDLIEINKSKQYELVRRNLENINSSNSIFSIQLIIEYLYLDEEILNKFSSEDFRINSPGTISGDNWSMVIPVSLEGLQEFRKNNVIKEVLKESERCK